MSAINQLTVLGGGVLGSQIAWHSAFKGKQVTVYDISDTALDQCRRSHDVYAGLYPAEAAASAVDIEATRSRLRYSTELGAAVASADLVIEAVTELPEIKREVYREMAPLLPEQSLVATNSSMLLPSDFAEDTGRPAQFCALHFANLIWKMNIAEIMAHAGTARETLRRITAFAIEIGMVPIPSQKENKGYVLNAWVGPLLDAAQALVTNGVSTPEDVDRSFLIANPGAAVGPMGLMDVIGMRTLFNVSQYWGERNNDAQQLANADYYKTHFLDQGKTGLQSGEGYYCYPNPAYLAADFIAVPDKSQVDAIADRAAAMIDGR